jgi:hypothetical protein
MSLLYYDQIRARNSTSAEGDQVPSLPFFLDFKNLTEEQQRIGKQLKQEARNKRTSQQQHIDQQVGNTSHEIRLTAGSTGMDYQRTWQTLCTLSLAEVDYQLRRFLIIPGSLLRLLQMVSHVLTENEELNMMVLNIIVARILELAGSELCAKECREQGTQLLAKFKHLIALHEDPVEKCIALSTHSL